MSKLYKGIVFNSTTVRALRGPLADAVKERNVRTAVVSNHSRAGVQEALLGAGVAVDPKNPRNRGRIDKRVPMWVPFVAEMRRNGPLTMEDPLL